MQKGILVTGGGHGIGKQICKDFLETGVQVCFMDFDKEISQALAAEHTNLFILTAMSPVRQRFRDWNWEYNPI